MSSTNKTDNYQLSQFVGSDIPSILNDYNGDMRKIDTAIHNASVAGGDNATAIAELNATTTRMSTEMGGINSTVNSLGGRVLSVEENVSEISHTLDDTSADVKAIQLCVPANASESNKFATMADISGVGGNAHFALLDSVEYSSASNYFNDWYTNYIAGNNVQDFYVVVESPRGVQSGYLDTVLHAYSPEVDGDLALFYGINFYDDSHTGKFCFIKHMLTFYQSNGNLNSMLVNTCKAVNFSQSSASTESIDYTGWTIKLYKLSN